MTKPAENEKWLLQIGCCPCGVTIVKVGKNSVTVEIPMNALMKHGFREIPSPP